MKRFQEWFEDRYGFRYPSMGGEESHIVLARLADAMALYLDEIVQQITSESTDHG
jgi:hypothetical protein